MQDLEYRMLRYMRMFVIFAVLFNICHANNTLTKNKPCFGATYLREVLNSYRSEANIFMKLIPLSQQSKKNKGKYFAMVDDADYEWLNQWKWNATKSKNTFYASRGVWNGMNMTTILMHRFILGLVDPKIQGDHKNRNGLDNRRCNLRIATNSQNQANRSKPKRKSSKYKGVYLCNTWNKWKSQLRKNGKTIILGYFPFTKVGEINAAIAYDKAAKKYHGEFAWLNFHSS